MPERRTKSVRPRRRFEDRRLLLGQSRFVGDLAGAGYDGLRAAFVRSPFAPARIVSMDVAAAQAAPGVVGIFTAADLSTLADMSVGTPSGPPFAPRRVSAEDYSHFVGESIAAIVATTPRRDRARVPVDQHDPQRPARKAEQINGRQRATRAALRR